MLTSTLEQLLNRGLPRSPQAQQLAAALAGRSLSVHVTGMDRFVLSCDAGGVRITRGAGEEAQARMSGGALSLLRLAGPEAQEVLQRGDVRIEGDAEVAQQYRQLLHLLRPDPEEELALLIGDAPAHRLGRLARGALGLGLRVGDTAVRNLAEYLAHESRDLVSRPEGRQLLDGIDSLREDVDRLEARLALLARQLQRPKPLKPAP